MGLDINYSDGQTPLEEEEKDGLLINSVTTRGELDEFEQLGVEKANEWLLNRNFGFEKILTEDFAKNLHRIMFADVWSWAGEFRKTNKNIEVDKSMITIELKNLFDDCKYWIENKTFSEDEIAVRLSHRIVLIHPFANGNGRHSRLIADILINKGFGKSYFTWGSKSLIKIGEARSVYLKALREADNLDYDALILFARS
ncbi:MAG TPA: mobile mystery protein B [Ignavibacteriaceae bacterium]|nr:mobile mystery protein B [Ignavibacterium sp.]HRN26643.1 mobile mystery protein B [Ignavibacteriaceae bacterium]HRP91941.1 mobile mystery protein B [Ignavibacteriaceae bacterium]HRQ54277.1 mobile mystery protein B [Ignavibacteriaceae bacterium]